MQISQLNMSLIKNYFANSVAHILFKIKKKKRGK